MSKIDNLIVDTSAFIKNVPLQEFGKNIISTQDVVDEITNKRQLRRLVVLPYDLAIKDVFQENIKFVSEFAKKTGDYLSLSSTDIKVIALTYQLEKEIIGVSHLKLEPVGPQKVNYTTNLQKKECNEENDNFFKSLPKIPNTDLEKLELHTFSENDTENKVDILSPVNNEEINTLDDSCDSETDSDSEWITPNNLKKYVQQLGSGLAEEKSAAVACMTTDFAMQNVLKQIGLNVVALDGKIIKQLRTFVFRCYACFKVTSIMTKRFCPNCGNQTLKKVAVTLDENGKQVIHINLRKPLTARGKKFSLPTPRGGKHSNNPILFEDQPVPDQRPSRLARTKTDPLNPDYIAGYSPFVMRDMTSRSAMLGIRSESTFKPRRNPNEARGKRK